MTDSLGFAANIGIAEVVTIPIDSVAQHPMNGRKHRLDLIMGSMTHHSQMSPLVIQRSTGLILKGNGTWQAAKQLGWLEVAVSYVDIDDDSALAYLLDDNRASDKAYYDKHMHLKALQMLMEGPAAQSSIWTADDVADLADELRPLVELDSITDAQYAHEGSEMGEAAQAKRGSAAQSQSERLKDVRFPLTLPEHAAFVERIKALSKVYGTAGSIATIIETVKRQSEWEADGFNVKGRQLDEAARLAALGEFKRELASMLYELPGDTVPKATVLHMLGDIPDVAPATPDVVPGQLPMPEGWSATTSDDATVTLQPLFVGQVLEAGDGLAELARIRALHAAPAPEQSTLTIDPAEAAKAAADIFMAVDE